jgi:hypothetical protein
VIRPPSYFSRPPLASNTSPTLPHPPIRPPAPLSCSHVVADHDSLQRGGGCNRPPFCYLLPSFPFSPLPPCFVCLCLSIRAPRASLFVNRSLVSFSSAAAALPCLASTPVPVVAVCSRTQVSARTCIALVALPSACLLLSLLFPSSPCARALSVIHACPSFQPRHRSLRDHCRRVSHSGFEC